ncbi:MAG: protein-glutamate O-methyltransferase CheR [Planctomycetota bacterium]|jgi:chemotaxis protein methyltransferase CheR|nr:protein-glutamate O-methyltransferase CheR [Planctomycetota bacterium]
MNEDRPYPPPPPDPNLQETDPRYRRRPKTRSRDTIYMLNPALTSDQGKTHQIPFAEFRELAALIYDNFGISLDESKRTMLAGRTWPMLDRYSFAGHRELVDAIHADATGGLLSELVNRISTNYTSFYREDSHFNLLLDKALPELTRRKTELGDFDLRVWCAGCATGEEAYTLLFCLQKFFHDKYGIWKAGVLATDISAEALAKAARGLYSRQQLKPVPPEVLLRCFDQVDDDSFEVKKQYRQEITFRRLNLVSENYPFQQPFDIIFCRNVMIYFTHSLRVQLFANMLKWLRPEGYFFVGHTESLTGSQEGFDHVAPAVYMRRR